MAIDKTTNNILNSEYIRSTIGVKQGGPVSCLLFIIYLNELALMLKMLGNDSFFDKCLRSDDKKMMENYTVLMNI